MDCVKWGVLPQVTEEIRQNCSFVKGRFTGDPSYEYEHTESKRNEDSNSDPGQDEETTVSLDHSNMLAQGLQFEISLNTPHGYIRLLVLHPLTRTSIGGAFSIMIIACSRYCMYIIMHSV